MDPHGHLDGMLLAIAADGPVHGYAAAQALEQRSGGVFDLPEGTIYPGAPPARAGGAASERLVDVVGPPAPRLPADRARQASGRSIAGALAAFLCGGRGGDDMSAFLDRLEDELANRGVRRSLRRRIVLEYADHLACDPETETRLGDPGELAGEFAAELAADDARAVAATHSRAGARRVRTGSRPADDRARRRLPGHTTAGVDGARRADDPDDLGRAAGRARCRIARRVARVPARRSRLLPDAEVALIRRRCAVVSAQRVRDMRCDGAIRHRPHAAVRRLVGGRSRSAWQSWPRAR